MKSLLSNKNKVLYLAVYLIFFVLTAFKFSTSTSLSKINNEPSFSHCTDDIVSLQSDENKLYYRLPFYNENHLPLLFFEGSEREEKEEREDFESFALSQLNLVSNGFNSKFLIASVKSYRLSIDNRFIIPLYVFQHSWKIHYTI